MIYWKKLIRLLILIILIDNILLGIAGASNGQNPRPEITIKSYIQGNNNYRVDLMLKNRGEDSALNSESKNGIHIQIVGAEINSIEKGSFDECFSNFISYPSVYPHEYKAIECYKNYMSKDEVSTASILITTSQENLANMKYRGWITDKDDYVYNPIMNQNKLYIARDPIENLDNPHNPPYNQHIDNINFSFLDYDGYYLPVYKINPYDTNNDAIWIGLEWTYGKPESEIVKLLDKLQSHSIHEIYLNLGTPDMNGNFVHERPKNEVYQNLKNFLSIVNKYSNDNNYQYKVLAWLNGNIENEDKISYDIKNDIVRNNIVTLSQELTNEVGFDGIHFDLEFWEYGQNNGFDNAYLKLLQEIRNGIPKNKILSIDIIPRWLDWSNYVRTLAENVDEIVLMAYDSGRQYENYREWVIERTIKMFENRGNSNVVIGVPTYDTVTEWHKNGENLGYALIGTSQGANSALNSKVRISIFADWETDNYDWKVYEGVWHPSTPPLISNVYHSPPSPADLDSVHIYAGISDTDGVSITQTKWSLDQSFVNIITMSNIGGDSYKTSSSIPAQSTGTTVNYKVCATDTKGNSGCSTAYSYNVGVSNLPPSVGVPSLSPNPAYQGQTVSISASVIDSDGNSDISTVIAEVQNGAGYIFSQSILSYNSETGTASGSITAPSYISSDYYVAVIATDKSGLQGSNQAQMTVTEQSTSCTPPLQSISIVDMTENKSGSGRCTSGGISYPANVNSSIKSLNSLNIIYEGANTSGGFVISNRYLGNTQPLLISTENIKTESSDGSANQGGGHGSNNSQNIVIPSSYSSITTTNSRDVQLTYPWDPIYETDFFRTTDTKVVTSVKLTNVYNSLKVKWVWYDPDSNYYYEFSTTTQDPKANGYEYWEWYKVNALIWINGYSAANKPGYWSVNIYIDDGNGYNLVTTEYFTIGYIISEHKTAKDHQYSDPYDPINPTTVFSIRDPKVESWTKLTNVVQGFTQKWEWYDPSNSLYSSSTYTFSDPGQDMYYPWYKTVWGISINGYEAANRPGNWTVKSYVENQYKFSDIFTISYYLADHTMEKDHEKTDPYNPIIRTTIFSRTDEKAESWLKLGNVADSLTVKWEWYTPSGILYTTNSYTSPDPQSQGYQYWGYTFWGWICIKGYSASDKNGQWTVKVYINDKYKYSEYFTITDDLAPSVGTSHSPQNPTDQDSVSITVNANDNAGLNKVELYWNDGALHTETWNSPSNPFSGTKDLGKLSVGKSIQYYAIAYDKSANTKQTSTYSFSVFDAEPPSISVSHSPIIPTDKDNISININANDNDILDKVELYWNNGTLQNHTWYPNTNYFSLNFNIGMFEGGNVVQYYAKAYDRSGKTNTTYTYSFIPTDTRPPASITNLRNTSYAQNYIHWTWTDSTDADFSNVSIWIDNIFKANVSQGVQFYNATGFTPDTEHIIATRTIDYSGNINQTWVNHTSRTATLSDTEDRWRYYRDITINNTATNTLTDYQVLVNLTGINFPINAQTSGSDLRFKDTGGAELSYWIENWDYANASALVWVNITSMPVDMSTLRMWYGNPSARSESNIFKTMIFGDDFANGTTLDTVKWTWYTQTKGTATVADGFLKLYQTDGFTGNRLTSNFYNIPSDNITFTTKFNLSGGETEDLWAQIENSSGYHWGIYTRTAYWDSNWKGCFGNTRCDWETNVDLEVAMSTATHKYDIKVFNGNASFYIDDSYKNNIIKTLTNYSRVVLHVDFTSAQTMWYDYIYVRKYASSEPSVSVGNETVILQDITLNDKADLDSKCIFDNLTRTYTCNAGSIYVTGNVTVQSGENISLVAQNEFVIKSTANLISNAGNGQVGGNFKIEANSAQIYGYLLSSGGVCGGNRDYTCFEGGGGNISIVSNNVNISGEVSSKGNEGYCDYYPCTVKGGEAGEVKIHSSTVNITGIVSSDGGNTQGCDNYPGNGGVVNISADSINFAGRLSAKGGNSTGIISWCGGTQSGSGGVINISSNDLILNGEVLLNAGNAANIASGASHASHGGELKINAENAIIYNVTVNAFGGDASSPIDYYSDPTYDYGGAGGNVTIWSEKLFLGNNSVNVYGGAAYGRREGDIRYPPDGYEYGGDGGKLEFFTNSSLAPAGIYHAYGGKAYTRDGTAINGSNGTIIIKAEGFDGSAASFIPNPIFDDLTPPIITIVNPSPVEKGHSANLTTIIYDSHPSTYQVYENISLISNEIYSNGVAFEVNINTSTPATLNYTIWANDTAGNQNSTTVWVTVQDTTPPSSITNLTNVSYAQTYINWTWTDPAYPDYSHVMLSLNGTFITNITAPQNYHNLTGLQPDTLYELGTHTVDTSGNVNETWVNATARTQPSGAMPPFADCGGDKIKCENVASPVSFNASASHDPDGAIISYDWDFGDGTNATGVTPVHKYSTYRWNGSAYQPFNVNLTVTDNDGMMNSTSMKVVIWIPGDANGDGKVNILDASVVGLKWGTEEPCADLNNDGKVNILDASIIGLNWGKIPIIQ